MNIFRSKVVSSLCKIHQTDGYHFSCCSHDLYDKDGIGTRMLVGEIIYSLVWGFSGGKGAERGEEREGGVFCGWK